MTWLPRALTAVLSLTLVFGASGVSSAEAAATEDRMDVADAPTEASSAANIQPKNFDGHSAAAFAESVAELESGMGEAQRFVLHMKLAQVRNTLAEKRGRPLTDAEFAAELDGKTVEEFDAMADSAPIQITIDIETSDDT